MRTRKHATDHRALVLESVATAPRSNMSQVRADCVGVNFPKHSVEVMVYQLLREGLLQRAEDGTLALTSAGLEWFAYGRFDKALPTYAERPGARKRRKPTP